MGPRLIQVLVTSQEERRCRGGSDAESCLPASVSALWVPRRRCTPGWARINEAYLVRWARQSGTESAGENQPSPRWLSVKQFSFNRVNKGGINPGEGVGVLGMSVYYWLVPRCWKCFVCMKKNSRCLLDLSVQGERKLIKPV